MDPGRRAMIAGQKPPKRDITSPRRDPNSRVSKPSRPPHSKPTNTPSNYADQDEKFVADEDKFVLKQAKKKADIRVRENRAKAIDYLSFNIRWLDPDRDVFDDEDDDVEIDVPPPEEVLTGLNDAQLKELEEDIKSYQTLETVGRNRDYWRALLALCADHRQSQKTLGPEGRTVAPVASDVDQIMAPKTHEQLGALESQIKAKLQSTEPIDTDYWEGLLKSLLVYKAKAKLKEIDNAIREVRTGLLKEQNPEKAKALKSPFEPSSGSAGRIDSPQPGAAAKLPGAAPQERQTPNAPPPGTARFASMGGEDFTQATKALYEREVARGVGENEEIFTAEEAVPSGAKPLWADKYRPRKPRYFNRVQMGYEWNKYNQTHYDHDNPPPKVVHGYKFNIFYPDLIDKTKAPTFKIIREKGRRRGESFAPAGEEDTCLIRFIAGPPYEDIAFRIVDREWDYSAKKDRGFKSSFDKVCSYPLSFFLFCSPDCRAIPSLSRAVISPAHQRHRDASYTHPCQSECPTIQYPRVSAVSPCTDVLIPLPPSPPYAVAFRAAFLSITS